MWRIFFWTKHNASKLEQFLSEMESKGYILEKIFFIYFLKFKPCALKKSVYFATFECASIFAFPMMDINMSLARDYKGIKVVNGGLFSPTIYRICIENPDLSMLELQRKEILKKGDIIGIVMSCFCIIMTTLVFLLDLLLDHNISVIGIIIFSAVIGLLCCIVAYKVMKILFSNKKKK